MRPQHASLTTGVAAQSLEDLGWNDMGAEDEAPRHDAEVAHLTPAPTNSDTAAEAHKMDQKAEAALAETPAVKPEVHRQQEVLSEKLGAEQIDPASLIVKKQKPAATQVKSKRKRRSALDRGKRAAFTLRLDADRHLKLRLACTLRSRSAQQLVTDALDQLLGDMPDVDSLAAQVRDQDGN